MAVVRARLETAHKARRADHATFETARQERIQFVLTVVTDTCVRELWDTDTIYTEVEPQDLFANLQAGCTSWNALDLFELHNEMQRYHLEVEGIHEYINMLKDAQWQAGWAGRTVTDESILLFSSTTMLTSKRFPRANNDWEDRAESDKTWDSWKLVHNEAHAKARRVDSISGC